MASQRIEDDIGKPEDANNMPENSQGLAEEHKRVDELLIAFRRQVEELRQIPLDDNMAAFMHDAKRRPKQQDAETAEEKKLHLPKFSRCSSVPKAGEPLVSHGKLTDASSVPWHAVIYEMRGTKYEMLCGGTLVYPNLVVTAAHCFWDFTTNRQKTSTYIVALGKNYRAWHLDDHNPLVQRMAVRDVIVFSRFEGWVNNNLPFDFAIVKLVHNATLSEFVQVALIAPGYPTFGSKGVVAGLGMTEHNGNMSEELRSIRLPYWDHDACREQLKSDRLRALLSHDKFCAGFIGENMSVCQGDSGGGFVVVDESNNMPTLFGVVSMDFRPATMTRDVCYSEFLTSFTNVGETYFMQFIHSHRKDDPRCPALQPSPGQVLTCREDYVHVTCATSMSLHVRATVECSQHYNVSIGPGQSQAITCRRRGLWSDELASCIPAECGQRTVRQAVVEGVKMNIGDVPWNIFIYERDGDDVEMAEWTYCKTGTLITPSYVITQTYGVIFKQASGLRLIAGRQFYNSADDEVNQQTRGVKDVITHKLFAASTTSYDIALLVADVSFQLTWAINPACIDWSHALPPMAAQDTLMAAAMKRADNKTRLTPLAPQNYTFVKQEECKTSVYTYRQDYITDDKFCAETSDDFTCEDLVGSGMMHLNGDKFYLRGVYSGWLMQDGRNHCAVNRLNAYTDVSSHVGWIKEHVRQRD